MKARKANAGDTIINLSDVTSNFTKCKQKIFKDKISINDEG